MLDNYSKPRYYQENRLSVKSQRTIELLQSPSVLVAVTGTLQSYAVGLQQNRTDHIAHCSADSVGHSQNHRMAEAGREHWGSAKPTSVLKQGHQEHITHSGLLASREELHL